MSTQLVGRYIVTDPAICHGKPTFRGTRIMVSQVLEMVAEDMDWDEISSVWGNKVSREAIAEAVQMASHVFTEHIHEYTLEPRSA